MAASIASVAVVVSHPLGVTADVSIVVPAVVASVVMDNFLVSIVANAVAVTVAITVMNIVVTIVTITVATVVTAIVPVSTTSMVLMYHVVLRVKSKEEEMGHCRDVLGSDVSKFVFET